MRRLRTLAFVLPALVLGACSHAPRTAVEPEGPPAAYAPAPPRPQAPGAEHGRASFYAASFEGRRTANGERYSGRALTAAHRTLPFGTRVRVTNVRNGRSVEVVINDRGPHHAGRVIDLSRRAAEEIDLVHDGVAPVRLEVLALAAEDLH